jgi:hypothetical protein
MSEKYQTKPGAGVGGMSGAQQTPANAHLGGEKPKALDKDGAIGKQFTGEFWSYLCHLKTSSS